MVGFATSGAPVAIMLADDAPPVDPVGTGDTRENLAAWASAGDYVFFQLDTADQALAADDGTVANPSVSQRWRSVGTKGRLPPCTPAPAKSRTLGLPRSSRRNGWITPPALPRRTPKGCPAWALRTSRPRSTPNCGASAVNVVTQRGRAVVLWSAATPPSAGYWLDATWWLLWMKKPHGQRAVERRARFAAVDAGHYDRRDHGDCAGGGEQRRHRCRAAQLNAQTKADVIATTGNQEFNGTLTAGYLLWVERPSQATPQSQGESHRAFQVVACARARHSRGHGRYYPERVGMLYVDDYRAPYRAF